MRTIRFWLVPGLIVALSWTGCARPAPLHFPKRPRPFAPWCGPQERVRIGQRVVGHVHDGNKYADFLVDAKGREHDPEQIANRAWAYLERTGDARTIKEALLKHADQTVMSIVAIEPVIVIMDQYHDASSVVANPDHVSQGWYWRAQIQPNSDPRSGGQGQGRLFWFSPDLKQRPKELTFSDQGVAEIALPNGKLILVREGDTCKSTRE